MSSADLLERIKTDPDFVLLKRFDNSLAKVEAAFPDGVPEHVANACFGMTEDEARETYVRLIAKLRTMMGVTE
jgi:hypothetical protein